jgi:hypothetical protein
VDRCALFVDAGYVLADGAMAVHGTRRGESVSWDYEGLLQLLSSLARERSGLPLLRCYWYETSVDGRRTAEHDALADLPGIKLRLAKIRPGRRDGVETEIHRDLTTLARNNAVSDVLVVSAEEELAQVIADVQDLGMRVTLVHIAVDGNWTISRMLRQESDDIVEISGEHLRPYVELIAGAEPPLDDSDGSARSNGHLTSVGTYQGAGNHVPAIYTAPVVAEYQRPALQLPRASARDREPVAREVIAREPLTRDTDRARDTDRPRDTDRARDERVRDDRAAVVEQAAAEPAGQLRRLPTRSQARETRESRETRDGREDPVAPQAVQRGATHSLAPQGGGAHGSNSNRDGGRENGHAAGAREIGAREIGARETPRENASREPARDSAARENIARESTPRDTAPRDTAPRDTASRDSASRDSASRDSGQNAGVLSPSARSAPYSGPQPVMSSGYPPQPSVSLADAVQAAHEEGQDFGESVARDAPALWLEAVLARKPRMPSDLEARLLQGSALPIDFLLHDEVRHALRRGFWDALERTRR